MPSARSREIDPVGITWIGTRVSSPRRITEPLPYCLSIWASATSSALSRSSAGIGSPPSPRAVVVVGADARACHRQFQPAQADLWISTRAGDKLAEQVFDRGTDTPAEWTTYSGRRAAVGLLDPDARPLRRGVRGVGRARPRSQGARRPHGRPGAGLRGGRQAGVARGLRGV